MATKSYVSNRFPNLNIHAPWSASIAFMDGVFTTDDPEVQAFLEKHDWYGIHIHPRDIPAAEPPAESAEPAPESEEPSAEPAADEPDQPRGPVIRRGARGTR